MIVMPPLECERLIKESIESEISSGNIERIIRHEVGLAYQEAVKRAFQSWDVQRAIEKSVLEIFKGKIK